jgi:hypothetical protein
MTDFVTIYNDDSIIYELANRMKLRAQAGMKTYGVSMDRKDLSKEQWYDHAIEEALDLAVYLTKLKNYEKD